MSRPTEAWQHRLRRSRLGPALSTSTHATGAGCYLMAHGGGVFGFGAPFVGSAGGQGHRSPFPDIAAAGPLGGYRLVDAGGGIISYVAHRHGGLYMPPPRGRPGRPRRLTGG